MKPLTPRPVPLEVLRAAVGEAIGTRSLREAAAEIGISHTGLRGFLQGARPHRHTRTKLEHWLARARADAVREPRPTYAAPPGRATFLLGAAAVRAIAAEAAPGSADRAVRDYARLVRDLFRNAGREPPAWLDHETKRAD